MAQELNCLITGCRLVVPAEKHVWGDLHELGNCYIFNAVLEHGEGEGRVGETGWSYESCLDADGPEKQIIATKSFAPFERRGVLVFPKVSVIFSDAAVRFLAKWQ